jgi:hypothetical protein
VSFKLKSKSNSESESEPTSGFKDTRPFKPYGPLPRHHARHDGLYLHGNRVVLALTVGESETDTKTKTKTKILEAPWFELIDGVPVFTRTLEVSASQSELEFVACGPGGVAQLAPQVPGVTLTRSADGITTVKISPRDSQLRLTIAISARSKVDEGRLAELSRRLKPAPPLQVLIQPGPTRWTAEIFTRGEVGQLEAKNGPFAVDTLTLPFNNPYRALFFVSGHDFLSRDVMAICTLHGDVWLVSGIDKQLERLHWKRFATGLFQPLGLKIVRGTIHVVGRDQITRLHDRDGNGEADWYENFNNDGHVTTNGHEYVTCLETDGQGNFYYLKGDSGGKTRHDGCLLRVSPDGRQLDVFATGFRNANGMAIGPNDEVTVAPQEGEWTPASGIFSVRPGGFHGAMSVHHRAERPADFVRPICWLSRRMDNSSGGQVWVPPGSWGPLGGRLLHLSYGQCSLLLVLREEVAGRQQGGVVPLPVTFRSGAMRGRFHPHDGHLYVSGLHGWVSNAVADGCLQRVRYVEGEAALPIQVGCRTNGLLVTLSEPLDKESAEDPENYQIEQWNYRWSAQYGSPELRPSQPNVEGRDRVFVESATVMNNGHAVFLEIPQLQPVSVLQLNFQIVTTSGARHRRQLSYTIHHIPQLPGCLAVRTSDSGNTGVPRFNLPVDRREALQAAFRLPHRATWQFCAAEQAQSWFESLRCGVCHSRDAESSLLPHVLAEHGELGWLPEPMPNLTWVGERLHASWLERFVGGRISVQDRPRPQLTARMPAFPAYASVLALGFAAQHGIQEQPADTPRPDPIDDPFDLAFGYRLTLKEGGLDCRQCHAVGSMPAQGDEKMRLAPGINFALVPHRMRYDFYRRFVLDPPRYDTNNRMPKFSADGRTTTIQHIYGGDARRQFDAIWRYLQTIHGTEP